MANTITINFIECTPAPASGYRAFWRVRGSGDPYTDAGNFNSSPIIITDELNPPGICYEGYIQSDCTESGMSGEILGEQMTWQTPCVESGEFPHTIELGSPCSGIASAYFIKEGQAGDIIKVRAQFTGLIQKISGLFTKAGLTISSPDGTSDSQDSACYTDTSPHGFSLTVESTITMVGATAIVNLSAVTHNSSASMSGVTVCIVEINGSAVGDKCVSGCKGDSATGGTC